MVHKIIVLGAGPAGLTAALYAARSNLAPLVFQGPTPGGQLMGTSLVENWPGTISIMGPELMKNMRDQALKYAADIRDETIVQANLGTYPFTLTSNTNTTYSCRSLIIATGATPKRLDCPGEATYWGKGITTCAVCDGALYQGKKVIVVGGGDTAMEDASFMTKFTDDITVVHILDKLTASAVMQKRVLENPQIKIIYTSTITAINGNGNHVTDVTIQNVHTKQSVQEKTDAVFVAIGLKPHTAIFTGQIDLNPYGYIRVHENSHTSVPGVFAAGDVCDDRYKQAITAAGGGCMAALDAERYLSGIQE